MGKLDGRIALVTGASRGLGRGIAEALAAEGAAVGVNYRSGADQAKAVVAAIEADGGRALAIQGDVSDFGDAQRVVQETIDGLGGLHILVNNAGISKDKLVHAMEPEDWQSVMNVNFGGTFNCTKVALAHMMRERAGSIINVSSVMGQRGWVGQANYSASKGAVNAFTRCAAMELARFDIRVNAVMPGFVPTELVEGLTAKDGGKGILKQLPMGKFGEVEDVSGLVTFLASDDSKYMTGALFTVDGGASAMLGTGAPLKIPKAKGK